MNDGLAAALSSVSANATQANGSKEYERSSDPWTTRIEAKLASSPARAAAQSAKSSHARRTVRAVQPALAASESARTARALGAGARPPTALSALRSDLVLPEGVMQGPGNAHGQRANDEEHAHGDLCRVSGRGWSHDCHPGG